MAKPWDPQKTLEPPTALKLIQEQFPELAPKHIRLLGVGWDNTAFIVNEELIFRFPRREIALPLLEAEWTLLPKLAPQLPLPIPVPKWRGIPTEQFPWPFIGYKMLPGFTACHANLSEKERAALAKPIAHFLSTLHHISPFGSSADNEYRIDWKWLTSKIQKHLEELALLNLVKDKKLESIVENLQNLRLPIMNTIVHGDFYVRHLLLNDRHELTGVIDWGDVHIGDPALDLAIAHSFLPPSAHEIFRKTYGEISEDTWKLAKLRAIHSSLTIILFGHHTGDPALLREGLHSIKQFLQDIS